MIPGKIITTYSHDTYVDATQDLFFHKRSTGEEYELQYNIKKQSVLMKQHIHICLTPVQTIIAILC